MFDLETNSQLSRLHQDSRLSCICPGVHPMNQPFNNSAYEQINSAYEQISRGKLTLIAHPCSKWEAKYLELLCQLGS